MGRLPIITVALLMVCAMGTACRAEGCGKADAREPRPCRTLWVFPPAVEFGDSDRGYRSLEIGVTPGMWASDDGSDGLLELRLGIFMYPDGECEGAAIYVGVRPSSTEIGLWYVHRAHGSDHSSGSGRRMSFRIGIGAVRGTDPGGTATGRTGLGAAIGFSF